MFNSRKQTSSSFRRLKTFANVKEECWTFYKYFPLLRTVSEMYVLFVDFAQMGYYYSTEVEKKAFVYSKTSER